MKSNAPPLRIAVIGSGPSGFFCADYLLRLARPCTVAMFERWPWPFGLVRDAVAPDKPKMRAATTAFTRTALSKGFSFWGNIAVGKDVTLEELRRCYHAVVITTGASRPRSLGIQGCALPGCLDAVTLAGWYNGRPDCASLAPGFDCPSVVVIGAGNAALDIARILGASPEALARTDISTAALSVLEQSQVTDIHVVARRGPYNVRFSPLEVEELARIPGCTVHVHAEETDLEGTGDDPSYVRMRQAYLTVGMARGAERRIHLHFNLTPAAILGDERVSGVLFEGQDMEPVHIPCGLVVVSIGQTANSLPGLPFDPDLQGVPSVSGRIQEEGITVPGMYTAGGVKRGANLAIGANKPDCLETVRSIIEDRTSLETGVLLDEGELRLLLEQRQVRVVTFEDWQKIDEIERLRGQSKGKPRDRFVLLEDLFQALDSIREHGGEALSSP